MTSLVGSQNYDLDDKDSDIDTFSFVFPPLGDIAIAKEPEAWMFELEDGHCEVKDIRRALNLLKKASPNSVEYFASKYKIYNPIFEAILKDYLDDNTKLWHMIHCDYEHMLKAIAGMASQLTTRNMPAGKRFSHAIRLDDMCYHFMKSYNAGAVLELRAGGDRELAFIAKRDTEHEDDYDEQCTQMALKLDIYKDTFRITDEQERIQQYGLSLIDSFQWKLFKKYLEETNK
jgi:predicted nucleotidyltransferase